MFINHRNHLSISFGLFELYAPKPLNHKCIYFSLSNQPVVVVQRISQRPLTAGKKSNNHSSKCVLSLHVLRSPLHSLPSCSHIILLLTIKHNVQHRYIYIHKYYVHTFR